MRGLWVPKMDREVTELSVYNTIHTASRVHSIVQRKYYWSKDTHVNTETHRFVVTFISDLYNGVINKLNKL